MRYDTEANDQMDGDPARARPDPEQYPPARKKDMGRLRSRSPRALACTRSTRRPLLRRVLAPSHARRPLQNSTRSVRDGIAGSENSRLY